MHHGTYPIPNSSQFALPTMGAPACRNSSTTVASKGDVKSRSITEEHVVGMDLVHMLSLTAVGVSCNGRSPAVLSTASGTKTNAFTPAFLVEMALLHVSRLKARRCSVSECRVQRCRRRVLSIAHRREWLKRAGSFPKWTFVWPRPSDPNIHKHNPNNPQTRLQFWTEFPAILRSSPPSYLIMAKSRPIPSEKQPALKKRKVAAEPTPKPSLKPSLKKPSVPLPKPAIKPSAKANKVEAKSAKAPSLKELKERKDKKGKAKATREDEPTPLPSTFKIMAGSYEKLLYGLEGTVTVEGSSHQFHLKPMFIFPAHISSVKAVAASPHGGKWLATGSADEIIKVWDLRRRKEIGGLMHHEGTFSMYCLL